MSGFVRAKSFVRFATEASLVVLAIALIAVPEWREGWPRQLLSAAIMGSFAFMLHDFHRAKLLKMSITQLYRTRDKPLGSAVAHVGMWLSFVAIFLPAP